MRWLCGACCTLAVIGVRMAPVLITDTEMCHGLSSRRKPSDSASTLCFVEAYEAGSRLCQLDCSKLWGGVCGCVILYRGTVASGRLPQSLR